MLLKTASDKQVDTNVKSDRKKRMPAGEWKLATVDPKERTPVDPKERNTWRSGMQSAMSAASGSQLPGRG